MKEDWTDKMKHKLEGHQKSAPEGVWEGICEQMGFDCELTDVSKETEELGKKRIRPIWRWAVAATLLALVGFFAFHRLGSPEEKVSPFVDRNAVFEKNPIVERNAVVENVSAIERRQLAMAVPVKSKETVGGSEANRPVEPVCVARNSEELPEPTATPETPATATLEPSATATPEPSATATPETLTTATPETLTTATPESPKSSETITIAPVYRDVPLLAKEEPRYKDKNESKWSVGLNASGGLLAANSQGNASHNYVYYAPGTYNTDLDKYDYSWNAVQVEENYVWKHSVPVRAGLSVSYQLASRLWLLSGVGYAYLYSQCSTLGKEHSVTDQRLHYVGIPLGVGYQVQGVGIHFRLYVSGRVLAEKNLEGSPWQLSVNVGVGAEYILSRLTGVYLEPSLGYYFDDGSSLEHYYKKHPLAPSIEFGVRMHINK